MAHSENAARIHVGVAGWYYPDWQGVVYPPGRQLKDHLRYLAAFVDCIEINNTFYRPPDVSDVATWCERVADSKGFKFTVKLWQRFTHTREERWRPAELEDFLLRLRPIFDGGFGGALLAQFPHSFHHTTENMEYLQQLLSHIKAAFLNTCRGAVPRRASPRDVPATSRGPQPSARNEAAGRHGIPVVVEVRHFSWNSPEAFSALDELGAGICSIDQPLFQGSLRPLDRVTSGIGYIRLHGRNKASWFNEKAGRDERYNYLYAASELEPWVERARKMAEKVREVYVIANNHFRGQAVCNALMFKASLEGRRVRAPAILMETYPVLKEYADPDVPMQETLF